MICIGLSWLAVIVAPLAAWGLYMELRFILTGK